MKSFGRIVLGVLVATLLASCTKSESYSVSDPTEDDLTLIYYGLGFNNLSSNISGNIKTMASSTLPLQGSKKHLLVFSHLTSGSGNYSTQTPSYLVEYSLLGDGSIQQDTILTLSTSEKPTEIEVMKKILLAAKDYAPAKRYSLIFSSHGTGWLPKGYYDSNNSSYVVMSASEGRPMTKSFGAECYRENGSLNVYEMDIAQFAQNIPFKLDCLIFDACLMGGVEVAYELKDIANKIVFSPAEVLSTGFDYSNLVSDLLQDDSEAESVAKSYYAYYTTGKGSSGGFATVTCIEPGKMDNLVSVCTELFENYRDEIASLKKYSTIQGYYSGNHPWFFDLVDVLEHAGISESEKSRLQAALDECIDYKAATPTFIGGTITTYCGLSIYLPSAAKDEELDEYYTTLAWNKATSFVK